MSGSWARPLSQSRPTLAQSPLAYMGLVHVEVSFNAMIPENITSTAITPVRGRTLTSPRKAGRTALEVA